MKNNSARLMIAFFWFGFIGIVATYSGNLFAFLAIQKVKLPFSTLEEFIQQKNYKLMYVKGDIFATLLKVITILPLWA